MMVKAVGIGQDRSPGGKFCSYQLHVPRSQPGMVARPRSADHSRRAGSAARAGRRPAGYGKSVLLSEWAGRGAARSPGCRSTRTTTTRCVLASRAGRPGPGTPGDRRAGWAPRPAAAAADLRRLVTALINDIVGNPCHPTWCSCWTTITSSPTRTCIPHSAFCFSTARVSCTSSWPAGRTRRSAWPSCGRAVSCEVRAADLRFTVDEAGELLRAALSRPTGPVRSGGTGSTHRRLGRGPATGRPFVA